MSNNPIPAENALPGTTAWQPGANLATTQIQAYCDTHAADPSGVVHFFVSVQAGGTTWTGAIYRLGWYQGTGARLIATIPIQTGIAQGYWDAIGRVLNNCPTAIITSATHLLEAGWSSSFAWTVPANAVTGVYLAQFTDANGKFTYCSFIVRGNRPADYAYIRANTTDVAYNDWGGYSLYTNPTVGVKVSFNRPDVNGGGTGGLLQLEIGAIKWFERQGYNMSYLSIQDIHENPAWLKQYGALLSGGHNEYWTREIRDGVEAALTSGVGMAFLGANAAYWLMRFEADAGAHVDRTVTCYKVATAANNLALDPFFGVDNTRVTSQFRDPVINRPESTLCGIMFVDLVAGTPPVKVAWQLASVPSQTYLGGTGLIASQSYGCDLVGDEYDKQQSGSPANLQIIGASAVTRATGNAADTAHTTTYVAQSGALVFASGSHAFTFALDSYRWSFACTPYTVPGIQLFMANIMAALLLGKSASSVQAAASAFSSFHN
ncbi:MAG: N,N-dimethylformamidase beta subunit family domain-containing protein [Ktedonobacteraceae bacterium]